MFKMILALAGFGSGMRENEFVFQSGVPNPTFSPPIDQSSPNEVFSYSSMQDSLTQTYSVSKEEKSYPQSMVADSIFPLDQCPRESVTVYPFLRQNFLMQTRSWASEEKLESDEKAVNSKEEDVQTFCVTGAVLNDGTGDADIIFKVGKHLERKNQNDIFVYHIQWQPSIWPGFPEPLPKAWQEKYRELETRRLTLLVEKALYHKLISGSREDYLSKDPKAIIKKINKSGGGKLKVYYAYSTEIESLQNLDVQGWIVASSYPILYSKINPSRSLFLPYGKTITFFEFGASENSINDGIDMEDVGMKEYTVAMGFDGQKKNRASL